MGKNIYILVMSISKSEKKCQIERFEADEYLRHQHRFVQV